MLKGYLYVNDDIFPTLLAVSSEEQERGLMFVEPPTPIMSFVYRTPQINRFWMCHTPGPLDIVFSSNGKVNEICYGKPFSTELIGGFCPSDLVVELPYGTCDKLNIKSNDQIGLVKSVDYLYNIEQIKNKISKKTII